MEKSHKNTSKLQHNMDAEVLMLRSKIQKIEDKISYLNQIPQNDTHRAFFTKKRLLVWYGSVIEIADRNEDGSWSERYKLYYDEEFQFEDSTASVSSRVDRGTPILIGRKLYAYDALNESSLNYEDQVNDIQKVGAYELITCSLLDLIKDPERNYKNIKWKRTKLGALATALLFSIGEENYDLDRKDNVIRELMDTEYFQEIDNIDFQSDYSVWTFYHEHKRLVDEKSKLEKQLKQLINPSPTLSSILANKKIKALIIAACIIVVLLFCAPYILMGVCSIFSSSNSDPASDENTEITTTSDEKYAQPVENDDAKLSADPEITAQLESKYDFVGGFENGLYQVQKGELYGFCNRGGEEVCAPKYDMIGAFDHGLYQVSRNDKYGFVNAKGEEVYPLEFDMVGSYDNGLIEVMKNDKYGYVNLLGKLVVPCDYDVVSYQNGSFELDKGDVTKYVDATGKFVNKPNNE